MLFYKSSYEAKFENTYMVYKNLVIALAQISVISFFFDLTTDCPSCILFSNCLKRISMQKISIELLKVGCSCSESALIPNESRFCHERTFLGFKSCLKSDFWFYLKILNTKIGATNSMKKMFLKNGHFSLDGHSEIALFC